MVALAVLFVALTLVANCCHGKSYVNHASDYEDSSLHYDIPLTPTQNKDMKNRPFSDGEKWFESNGVLRASYFSDARFLSAGEVDPATRTATTTVAPNSCILTGKAFNKFEFKTKSFPSTVPEGTTCSLSKTTAQATDMVFTRLDVDYRGDIPYELDIKEAMLGATYGYSMNVTEYALWPLTIQYKAGSSTGMGFKVTARPVTGLPVPCNGQTINLAAGKRRKISNPLIIMRNPDARCAFMVTAPFGRRLLVTPTLGELTEFEFLRVASKLPDKTNLVDCPESSFISLGSTVKVYYAGSSVYTPWALDFKVV